ncbi:monovalent cation/H+ antiporter complex subunit F [Thermanaerothrix sp.]|jgi:multicomponent Na+:H+ antiporter subunit F|uniref:monovalent cation/H+ antiporter complex subunit F n=1 Tax=Thermanaerothrix sp. TaxID=2972675 RepID=UPI002ADDC371|nr:monovalent cation/H+ antiporter complex subunit F [Thermanaerothrix sp.]
MSLTLVAILILSVLTAGMILTFIRLLRGPSLPDRIVALDLIVTLLIGIIATYAILNDQAAFLDVAIILALVSFLGTVAFAYYIERRV